MIHFSLTSIFRNPNTIFRRNPLARFHVLTTGSQITMVDQLLCYAKFNCQDNRMEGVYLWLN